LKSTISKFSRVDKDDVKNTKSTLRDFGFYPTEKDIHGFTDNEMFDGIRDFQFANNLNVDGIIRPVGETKNKINDALFAIKKLPLPKRKPKAALKKKPPLPIRKPGVSGDEKEEALERLKERLKMQKKFIDFLRKGMRGGPLFLYDLNKRTQEILDDQVI
ncbi:MAG: hypothetical protein COB76_03130, partial [Alphaproteobacteria bacterium]